MSLVPHHPSDASSDRNLEFTTSARRRPWGWQSWVVVSGLLILPAGVAFFALTELMQIPAVPQCFNARQSPPSHQIYCAEQLASKHDTESLRRAILLANAIDRKHPLRDEGDRLINIWAQEILRRAEAEFQNGNLQGAIDIAQQVPSRIRPYQQVQQTVQAWEDLWQTAEELYQQGQTAIEQEEWYEALSVGRRLLQLDNRYWTTERYRELMRQLQVARDNQKNNKNKPKIAQSPPSAPPANVEDFLSQWEREQEEEDRSRLQRAQQQAQSGDVEALKAAIAEAQGILYGTDSYDTAQQAIAQWRQQMETLEDRPYIERAQQLANQGDLQGAISEASNVSWGRALYGEARGYIDTWRDQAYQQEAQRRNAEMERIIRPSAIPAATPIPAQSTTSTPTTQRNPSPSPGVPAIDGPVN
ncbi:MULTISPECIES: hypothetical protein [unclassified Leptolyngbya]|uniref:hypothetical protein n=1 Tax=unclassified Leptolyngbya TaxID=2650499 RepID=UPI0016868DBC|nr:MULTISPECIES: hypothetical protein [unclassified Leptolyngbya]MBD1911383.1 hypothetical protein [Leptolyngbya sp. FACHB-8]MBD2156599.1 hypothetical protein [Leptolyngbya sp. FACHB-16]